MPATKPEEEQRRQTVQFRVLPKEFKDFVTAAEIDAPICPRCDGGTYTVSARGGKTEERVCISCNGSGRNTFKYSSWVREQAVAAADLVINPPAVFTCAECDTNEIPKRGMVCVYCANARLKKPKKRAKKAAKKGGKR
jgi:hypothetical protein